MVPKDNGRAGRTGICCAYPIIDPEETAMAQLAQHMEVLTFALGSEEYGIDIQMVQELRGYEPVTKMANVPDYFKGVVNLRGVIVPIIDMRIKFKLGEPTYDQLTVVIILNIRDRVVGMVVDGVSDVTELSGDQIKPAPSISSTLDTSYLMGIGAIDDRMIMLVDIDGLMSSDDIGAIEKLAA
jgi:purine-binding chemotaxis protein CheW